MVLIGVSRIICSTAKCTMKSSLIKQLKFWITVCGGFTKNVGNTRCLDEQDCRLQNYNRLLHMIVYN